jgi:RNA polymerase II elongation factor ELL
VAAAQANQPDTAGADAALATLQNSMASYQQERKAKSTTITEDLIPEPKSRWEAAKKPKRSGLLGMNSGSSSPSLSAVGTPRAGLSVTSAPNNNLNLRRQAMRTPLIHLLAIKPASTEDIIRTTHIPKSDLEAVVSKVAQNVGGQWKLSDRAYKDLNVWEFGYKTQQDRQMAIDNAIRAYDRTRVGKEENTWQLLLPKEERGKGKVLSKLNLATSQTNRGSTPNSMPSPLDDASEDEKPTSSANTPRPGQTGTPKSTVAKSAGSDLQKRLLAKDPKKARAAEEAKDKRKRDREAVASDKESRPLKKQKPAGATSRATASSTAAKASSKIKSAELVHSSDDDDEEGEVKETPPAPAPKVSRPAAVTAAKPQITAARSPAPENDDNHVKTTKPTAKATATAKAKTSAPSTKPAASTARKEAAPGGSTPSSSALSAPQRQRNQLSPSKSNSRPTVPSPLGAARPRNASDVSDRSAVGILRAKHGASTPKGLGITSQVNGVRKTRQEAVASQESTTSSEADKKAPANKALEKGRATTANGVSAKRSVVATSAKPALGTKRKATEALPRSENTSDPKHRKTDSASTLSQRSHSSSFGTVRTMATTNGTSPDAVFDSGSSDSSSIMETITYEQGVEKAKKFRENFYPQYVKLYDSIAERNSKGETIRQEERDKLWRMHHRLQELKREIGVAAKKG